MDLWSDQSSTAQVQTLGKKMGRTIPSFRIAAEMERTEWRKFRSLLNMKDRNMFDQMFSYVRFYNSACMMQQVNGKWGAYIEDGTEFNRCFGSNGKKEKKDLVVLVNQQQTKTLTLEDLDLRLKLIESVILDPRRTK
jgi:hypothetical protein